jgi:hypothetical protein
LRWAKSGEAELLVGLRRVEIQELIDAALQSLVGHLLATGSHLLVQRRWGIEAYAERICHFVE